MKRPSETLRELCFDNLIKTNENLKYNFSNAEKFMIWIVGFSIAGLSLIVSNFSDLSNVFTHSTIKIVLILLSISIITGIIYRWSFYIYQSNYQNIEFYLRSAFSNADIMETDPQDISEIIDIKEIIRLIKIDFGEDFSFVLNYYNQGSEPEKNKILGELKEHYRKIGEWAKRDYELGLSYVKNVLKNAFGITEKKVNSYFNANSSLGLKIAGIVTSYAFLASCLTFIAVIIILCSAY